LRSHITKEYLGYSTDYKSVFDDIVKEKTTWFFWLHPFKLMYIP
jgi:hypothetical protein